MSARSRLLAAAPPVVAAFAATVIALVTAGFDGRWDVPLEYSGDGLAVAAHVKTVLETGWYEWQPALGAPYGQVYHDYPVAENLHFAVAALLGVLGLSWGAVMNVHFLLGFALAGITGTWFLRRLGVSAPLAATLGVVFAIAPYHYARGEGHLFLSWYWVVPFGVALAFDILAGRPLWGTRARAARGLGHLTGRTGRTVLVLAALGSASVYYSAFTAVLCLLAFIGAIVLGRRPLRVGGVLAAGAVLASVLLLNTAPDTIHALTHGRNPGALQRTPVETEHYALKLAQLLLPPAAHRIGPLRELRALYDAHYPLPSESPALGALAGAGLVILVVVVFVVLARATRAREDRPDTGDLRLPALAFLALGALLFAWVGGLSTFVSFVTPTLRAWNRMSIVIALIALACLGICLDRLLARARGRGRVAASVVVVVALLAIAIVDQTPAPTGARTAHVASFDSDASFVAALEDELPAGSLVFEVPALPFPESPPQERALDADQLRPYLHSTTLRFSGGGIRGREDIESLREIAQLDPAELVAAATALGYRGVVVDTWAYDAPESVVAALGDAALRSPDGRFTYVDFD